jgi:two-component system osmolarity sensor histidine kinase EnvZ
MSLKRYLPRTLFGRSLLILLLPVLLAQIVAMVVFYDRHWQNLTNRLAYGVAGDVALAAAIVERQEDTRELLAIIGRNTDLSIRLNPAGHLPEAQSGHDLVGRALNSNLAKMLQHDRYEVTNLPFDKTRAIWVQTSRGVLEVTLPERRVYSVSGYIFILWMVGSALFFIAIAVLFMRNQIRPIKRLAEAAEQFGKGREVKGFRPQGAIEVRAAAHAFMQMKERLKRQIKQRTDMLAGVSHDLRTPLTRMKLQLALMNDEGGKEELTHDITEMERMVEGYLSFARGEGEEEAEPLNFSDLLERVVEDARRASDKPVILKLPEELLELTGRPQALRRCLGNLIGNAQRYASHVTVTARRSNNDLIVEIDDDGPGIPPEKRREVLRPFVRLEESRNPDTGGVGLGLTIARDIARSHGGDLQLGDSPSQGLRVTLRIPL